MKWSFLSDPKTVWDGERWEDFLRTSTGQQCKKSADGNSWQIGFAPDEVQTRKRALNILEESGVATADNRPTEPRSAMVAPGYQGCRSPCLCGGNRSKHIAGQANDMKPKEAMKLVLPNKFVPPGADSFNKYLARFGLKRPMASESWHVEPTS